MKKKLITLLAFLCLSITVSAEDYDFESGKYHYRIINNSKKTVELTSWNKYREDTSTSITIPSTVTYNGITYSVVSIGEFAFSNGSALTSIIIPNSVKTIGEHAFSFLSQLSSVKLGTGITTIGDAAFCYCTSLTSITIPSSVTRIEEAAFRNCSSLSSISIPSSVTYIGEYAFDDTKWYDKQPNGLIYINKVLYTDKGRTANGHIVVKDGTVCISPSAFSLSPFLSSITLPNSLKIIGKEAFDRCNMLTSITFGNGLTTIEDRAFYGCQKLTSITLPNSLTHIGNEAFDFCTKLSSIKFGQNITYIGENALSTPWYDNQPDGLIYIGKVLYQYKGDMPNNTSLSIKNGTVTICPKAFVAIDELISITLPNTLKTIGKQAFYLCKNLSSVSLGTGLTTLEEGAFSHCLHLTSLTLPNSLTYIGDYAFEYVPLTSITIPKSITYIGAGICWENDYLTSVFWNVKNSDNCTSLGAPNISSITFGNEVENIPNFLCYRCEKLSSVTISNSVDIIGRAAFGETSLSSLTIPPSVTYIMDEAFYLCSSIASITCYPTTPPICGLHSFEEVPTSIPVYCPCGSIDAYQSATQWKTFSNIKEPSTPFSLKLNVSDKTMGKTQLDQPISCDGTAYFSATANYGYHFTNWSDGNTDNPRILTLSKDMTLTALFAPNQYTLTVNSSNEKYGIVLGGTTADYLSEILITAIANEGYRFVQWNDKNLDNPRTITLTEDLTLTAIFEQTTGVEELVSDNAPQVQKIFRDGQIIILRNGKAYTVTGIELK